MGRVHAAAATKKPSATRHVKGAAMNAQDAYKQLTTEGVVVVECDSAFAATARKGLLKELAALGDKVRFPAAGGFGAVGAPEMAASPTAYAIDAYFHKMLSKTFIKAASTDSTRTARFGMFDDRVGIRPRDGWVTFDGKTTYRAVPTAESEHRDMSVTAKDTFTAGGFINEGEGDQFFDAVPYSALGFSARSTTGFKPFSRTEAKAWRSRMKKYRIKPGQAVFFDSTIVHRVASGTATRTPPVAAELAKTQLKEAHLRKYVSFWLTISDKNDAPVPSVGRTTSLHSGKPPRLPGGQPQPFTPGNWSLHPERLAAFRAQFNNEYMCRFPTCDALKEYPADRNRIYEG